MKAIISRTNGCKPIDILPKLQHMRVYGGSTMR